MDKAFRGLLVTLYVKFCSLCFFLVCRRSRSRFQEDHETKKDIGNKNNVLYNRKKKRNNMTDVDTSKNESHRSYDARSPGNVSLESSTRETINSRKKCDDLLGSQVTN